jgi:hypothetical protein
MPDAGTVNSSCIFAIRSGVPIVHVAGYAGRDGSFFRSPGFAPASIQRRIVWRSASDRRRSLVNTPCGPSACHGGITPAETASRVSSIFAFALSNSTSEKGASPPG